jgi:hypothetical protein
MCVGAARLAGGRCLGERAEESSGAAKLHRACGEHAAVLRRSGAGSACACWVLDGGPGLRLPLPTLVAAKRD